MIPRGLDRVEASVRERCLQDDRIHPAWHFERSALTWVGDCWQRRTPEQWEELFHLPRAYTFVEGLPDCPKQRELALLRMLGNTWDVKVVRCFYHGLLESIGQPTPASFFDTVADFDADLTIADPYEELWGKTQQDFVDTFLRHIPEPLASLAWPFRHLLDHADETLSWCGPLNKGNNLEGSTSRRYKSSLGMEPPQHRQIRGRSRVHVCEDPARGRAAPRWFPP